MATRRISNPIVLTGDIHSNWVNDLKVDFVKNHADLLSENPFVKFQNSERGYVRCTVTPQEWRSDVPVVEYVDKPGAPQSCRGTFVVEDGKPGAIRA